MSSLLIATYAVYSFGEHSFSSKKGSVSDLIQRSYRPYRDAKCPPLRGHRRRRC